MNNINKSIKLDFDGNLISENSNYYAFNINGEFILYDEINRLMCIYSTTSDIWRRTSTYMLPKDFTLISISKYNKLYLLSENYIYEWNGWNHTSNTWGTSNTMKQILVYKDNNNKDNKEDNKDDKDSKDDSDSTHSSDSKSDKDHKDNKDKVILITLI